MEDKEKSQIQKQKLKVHPEEKYNFLSHLLFCWQIRMVIRAWRKENLEDYLYVPCKKYESKVLGDRLEQLWKEEQYFRKNPSLTRALIKLFSGTFIFFGMLILSAELATLILQPLLLKRLLDFYTHKQKKISLSQAYLYVSFMTLITLWRSIIVHFSFRRLSILGLNMRITLSSLIYRKALKLKQCDLKRVTVGKMINLLSNDVSRFDFGITYIHYLWNAPVLLVATIWYVYFEYGLAALSGVAVIAMLLLIQVLTTKTLSSVQRNASAKTDHRVRLMNDIISGIETIKLYTWEKPFCQLVEASRRSEMTQILRKNSISFIKFTLRSYVGKVCLFASVLPAVLRGQNLTAQYVFSLSSIYNILQVIMTVHFQNSINSLVEITTAIKRIQEYLLLDHQKPPVVKNNTSRCVLLSQSYFQNATIGVHVKNVTATWDIKSHFMLKDVDFEASPGNLVGVIGAAGSGKSTLLHIVLQEVQMVKGTIHVGGRLSYASQEPWIFSASIRQNILFGEMFDSERYTKVIRVCALEHDLSLFAYGDQTLVGERGVMLSGGQKARINLARAVYRNADVYLFDDPLSAVDANVAQRIFNECICGYLRKKCIILVTHQVQFLQNVDKLYVIEAQKVVESDKENLKKHFIKQESHQNEVVSLKQYQLQSEIQEHRSSSNSQFKVYLCYIKAVGQLLTYFVFIAFVINQLLSNVTEYFLSFWVNLEQKSVHLSAHFAQFFTTYHCLYIYSLLLLLLAISAHVGSVSLAKCCQKASRTLHNNMLGKIFVSTITFFNQHSSGRILNRFTKDLGSVDEVIPLTLMIVILNVLTIIGIIILIICTNYWMAIPAAITLLGVMLLSKFFHYLTRSIKKTEGITRSCLLTHLSASLHGLTTIKAFTNENVVTEEFDRFQDYHTSASYLFNALFFALGFWTDIVCFVFAALVRFSFFFVSSAPSAGAVGLAISQANLLLGLVQITAKSWGELESEMVSVERVLEYTELEPEVDNGTETPPESWPQNGNVSFQTVSLRYLPENPLVLKNVTVTIQSGEKVGIVGRTGAGKTSLSSVLFRLFSFSGTVLIDGVNTKSISLNKLRSKISIIPQEPVLFLGTLRKNIDPFDEYSDDEIWKCLEETDLKEKITTLESGLDSLVSERGSNFSVGQRQLLCLVRAMLRKNKIVVLDEATANVDLKTDGIIQATIRKKFSDCTVLTIAHRLNTVVDSDKILVMEDGVVVEFGHPYQLLQNTEGYFYSYVKQNGSAMMEKMVENAKVNYRLKNRFLDN